jgi:hypothetical protein
LRVAAAVQGQESVDIALNQAAETVDQLLQQ